MRRTALAALAVLAALPASAHAREVRVFAVGPKFSLDWVDTRDHFRAKLLALADARLRSAPGTPAIQRGAGDVASHLSGRDLVTLPEDVGLMAAFTGTRGTLARGAADLTTSILGLIATYAPVSAYYGAKFPSLVARPFPPTRLLATALTDTFVRTAVETFAELAQKLRAYVIAGVVLAQDWQVVCDSKETYVPPPGAGPCAVADPVRVALLRSPDEPRRDYAYEATTDRPSTMALVFDPSGRIVAKTVKAYLTPTELPGQLDLVPGAVSGVRAIQTPLGRIGIVTSKDAWMPDVTSKLDAEHAEILVQPEFFVNDTVSTTGPWSPDNIEGAGFSDLLRHPSIQALVVPQLVGNVFDFSADSQLQVAVKPGVRARAPSGSLVGQDPAPGWAAISRWVVADPLGPGEPMSARRVRLGRAGQALLPSSSVPCTDAAVAGPCRGGQVEDVIWADVHIGAPQRRTVAARRAPAPFARSHALAAGTGGQRNVALAMRGRVALAAYEQRGRVYVKRSRDAGAHWSAARAVDAASGRQQWWPAVAIGRDGAGYVAWQDGGSVRAALLRGGRPGTPFGPGRVGDALQWRPTIAVTGHGRAVLAWVDERGGLAGIYTVTVDGTRIGSVQRLDTTAAPDPLAQTLDNAWAPSVAARGAHVLITWVDFHDYEWNAEARESADGGATFGPERTVNPTPAGVEAIEDTPRAAWARDGRPLVAYTDWFKDDASHARPSRLYDTMLSGLGGGPVQADGHGGAHVSTFAPALAPAGDGALVAWQDQSRGAGRIEIARVSGAGRAGAARRVDDGGRDGYARARPALATGGGYALVAWEDQRSGSWRIRMARAPLTALLRLRRRPDERRPLPKSEPTARAVASPLMTALLLLAVVALVFVNGFFVAAEFALVRARRGQLEELQAEGRRGAKQAIGLLDDLNQYLSACQFGVTLASLGIGFLGEPAIAKLIEPAFDGLSHGWKVAIAIFLTYLIVTAVHITIGEQVPKIYSIVRAERTALRIARPLTAFTRAMRPFISLLNGASTAILRLMRIDANAAMAGSATPDELRILISQARAGGQLDAGEAGMLHGVFHLHEQEARQVMTPYPAVVTADTSEDVETALRRCISSGHTRLVVTEDENPDRVRGIVHSNSLARALMAEGPSASIEPLVKDAPIVPETKPLDDLLADLQRARSSMAVVIDEYGRVAGIVSVEDIVEEVVGEIDDETDPAGGDVRQLANGDWFVRGHVAVTDLTDYGLDLPVDSDAYNSVGGFVFAELGRLPRRGDSVIANGFSIRVESVRENRVEAVRIRERQAPAGGG